MKINSTKIKKAVITAQLEENKASTDFNLLCKPSYINFSINQHIAEHAPDAQLEEQRSNKSCLHRFLGSIPSWGGSALFGATIGDKMY